LMLDILDTFAYHRPDIGYVQGMTYITGMLLLHMDEYSAFQTLTNILSRRFFFSLYTLNIPQLVKFVKIYDLLFGENIPELFIIFSREKISPQLYLLDWFFTIFSTALPFRLACRVWDCYFIYGELFMFQTALAIIQSKKKELMSVDYEERLVMLKYLGENMDEETLFTNIKSITIPSYLNTVIERLNV